MNITKPAMDLLIQYNWPGNIRDLENAIQSAMILCQDNIITEDNLPIRVYGYSEAESDFETGKESLGDKINQVNSKVEKEIIIKALRKCNNNRTKAAKFLRISRKTLFNKMKIYKLFDGNHS